MAHLKGILWLIVVGACLFVPAGTHHWRGAWIFLITLAGGTSAVMGWLARTDPALYAERRRRFHQPGQPGWDRSIGLAIAVVWFAWLIAMGLAVGRFGAHPPAIQLAAGIGIMAAGLVLCTLSFKANTFATTAVRLQPERGQQPIATGPYGWVRHPIYSASLLVHTGTLLLLGPRWGGCGYALLTGLLVTRIVLEERLLRAGLPGYTDYMAQTRWRLLPHVW
jgi:protein-S-isoprenylcysteine O-methyltransferase Ste14